MSIIKFFILSILSVVFLYNLSLWIGLTGIFLIDRHGNIIIRAIFLILLFGSLILLFLLPYRIYHKIFHKRSGSIELDAKLKKERNIVKAILLAFSLYLVFAIFIASCLVAIDKIFHLELKVSNIGGAFIALVSLIFAIISAMHFYKKRSNEQ